MATTYRQRWGDQQPGQSRRRSLSLALTILAHVAILLLLLYLAPQLEDRGKSGSSLKTFQVAERAAATTAHHARKAVRPHPTQQAAARPHPKIYQPSKVHDTEDAEASAIWALGRGIYRQSDISHIASAAPAKAENDGEMANAGGEGDSGSTHGRGAGPGGAELYNAQWYREPSEAEMATYLPKAAVPGNWGEVECKTAPNYRVESCRELAQSPPGVGISRALRQASFQFQVVPPRVNGKPIIGAWVRIRFDIVDGGMRVHH